MDLEEIFRHFGIYKYKDFFLRVVPTYTSVVGTQGESLYIPKGNWG